MNRWRRIAVAAAVAVTAIAPGASAHSPTDFLKVPVGQVATVLLPPVTTPAGPVRLSFVSPPGFGLVAVSAGPGWTSQVTYGHAVLTGQGGQAPVLVSLSAKAEAAGTYPLTVSMHTNDLGGILPSGYDPEQRGRATEVYRITALNGWIGPSASHASSPINATVNFLARTSGGGSWKFTAGLVLAAVAVLTVGTRRDESHRMRGERTTWE